VTPDNAEPAAADPFAALVAPKAKKVRHTKTAAESSDPKLPPRAVCCAIIRRFLKPTVTPLWSRELPTFYRLYRLYPSLAFWEAYELPFGNNSLNMLGWFERGEGPAELDRAYRLFHYIPPPPEPAPTLDDTPPTQLSSPQVVPRRPRTVAEMLTTKPTSTT